MTRPFILLASAFLAVFIFAHNAQSSDLFFAPKRAELSDKQPISEIRVTNKSNISKGYKVVIEDVVMTEEGITTRVDGFDYSASRMVRFVPRQFDLDPGERQIIRIMARISPDKPDGEYHSHLSFLEDVSRREALNQHLDAESTAQAKAQVSYTTAIPLILSKGDIETKLDISDLSLKLDDNGIPAVSMMVGRSGNGQGNALIEIQYISPNGAATKVGGRRNVYVYRELDKRKYSTPINLPEGAKLQKGGTIKVILFNKDISSQDPIKELTLSVD